MLILDAFAWHVKTFAHRLVRNPGPGLSMKVVSEIEEQKRHRYPVTSAVETLWELV